MNDALLKPLERLLNRQIKASTPARDLCRELAGRVLVLAFRDTGLAIYMVAHEDALSLHGSYQEDPDAVLRGSPLAFAALANDESAGARVDIEGDTETARQFQELLGTIRPDWEEELSRLTGDVAAHQIGNLMRGAMSWGRRAVDSLSRDLSEFLQEESRDVPAREEVAAFDADLQTLRSAVARSESRLDALERKLGP